MSSVPSGDLVSMGSMLRDDNDSPVYSPGLTTTDTQTLIGNNTTIVVPIFSVTGSVSISALWGVVTTTLGANNTAAYWRLNDQTAQLDITLNTGTTLSGLTAGTTLVKKGLATAALTALSAAAGRVSEPTTLETAYFSPFVVVQKTGNIATNIEFVYTTTDTPTSGVIKFYVQWFPLSPGANIQPL